METIGKIKKKPFFTRKKLCNALFYAVMAGIPIIQVCIFYIGVNLNSVLLAFRKYDFATGGYKWD